VTLDELRDRIDSLDMQILQLLNERAQHAVEIGEIKRSKGESFYVPERERAVYDKMRGCNPGPLPNGAIKSIYREVISAIRALEEPLTIAFLGPRDTFSHIAALRMFGAQSEYLPLVTVDDVFTEVERKRADYGVVPVETAMGGTIGDTLDRFISSELKIVNELMIHVTQNLLSNVPLDGIERDYSKSQPFVQCRNWLKANLPNAELVEVSSTAEAARIASSNPGSAAIASELAAETYNIRVLVRGIEDSANNFTRFFVIGRHIAKPTGKDKTVVVCSIVDKPGTLFEIITPFAKAGINLTRIESRPSRKRAWDYVFFIDLLGHSEEPHIAAALDALSRYCKELKILGSFPQGELEE